MDSMKERERECNKKLMFHRAITHHSTEETKEGFRTRAVYSAGKVRARGVVRRRRLPCPSHEEWFCLQLHYVESSGMEN